jgi:hypothetical protein
LSDAETNYTKTKYEGLAMVYALQKKFHYFLGSALMFFNYHSVLKYLFKNPVLGGRIYQWLFIFLEFYFKFVINPEKHNVGLDNLSQIKTREVAMIINDELPYS